LEIKKRDRQIRELTEDVRLCRGDLERERETVTSLKSTISQLNSSQLAVTTQRSALQAQITALTSSVTDLRLTLGDEQKKVERMEKEARESETLRRKLHNMVQELKGNIRVFCRVRPILSSDLPVSQSPATNNKNQSPQLSDQELEKLKAESLAEMTFPDWRDHKEITVSSYGESAMGLERRETHNFGFDRVRLFSISTKAMSEHPTGIWPRC
jgi:kinesin family protein C1